MPFAFGEHVLDVERRELRRGGDPVAVEPQVFDLIVYLVQNRDRVVTKDELLDAVWGGRIVSESALTARINAVRRAVGDSGEAQAVIRTIQRRGFRFIAEVREEGAPATMRDAPALEAAALALPDKPSIAVLPFLNLSGDPDQEYFADGMIEEIITALSRIRWLFVIARNSSFTYKGQAIDVKQVGRELGVRYLLEGSVRKASGRVRIAAQLIEAETGRHVWADRFDGALEEVFELQDEVASSVAGVIEPELLAAETARSASRRTSDLNAYDLYLRAYAMYWTYRLRPALALLEEAIARDPHYGPALGLAAQCCQHLVANLNAPDQDAIRPKGIDFGRRAIEVAGDDPGVLADAAMALAVLGEDLDAMIALVDRALTFNPNYARGWHISSWLCGPAKRISRSGMERSPSASARAQRKCRRR